MNKYIKHWSVAACAALTLTAAFSSCSKDSESVEELMERNYPARVYLQGDRYSAPALTHTLKHSSDGIEGELGGSVTVRLTRPQAQDVVVSLKYTLDKAELKDALKVSAAEATIKAGQITSDPITFTIDKSKLETKAESQTFKVSFSIDAIKSAPAGLQLSSNQNLYAVTFHKRKQSEDALIANYTGNVAYLDYSELDGDTRATKWKLIDVTPGIQGANTPTVLSASSARRTASPGRRWVSSPSGMRRPRAQASSSTSKRSTSARPTLHATSAIRVLQPPATSPVVARSPRSTRS